MAESHIELQCEKCGHRLRAPRDAIGKYAPCPHCKNKIYIPTPASEIEELPLAEEDSAFLQREADLEAERRRLDRALAREKDSTAPTDAPHRPQTHHQPRAGHAHPAVGTGRTSVRGVVITYLEAMRDSDLHRAQEALALLATHKQETLAMVDRLAADQIPPVEMAQVPAGVYQGFLKNLRSQL